MERLRKWIRGKLGYRAPFYRWAAKTLTDSLLLLREGPETFSRIRRLRAERKIGPAESVQFRSLAHPMLLRPGTSDISAALQNVVRHEYGHVSLTPPPSVMIDGGAYIGDTAAYFLSKYPGLRVYAFEPNPESYELAKQNLTPYGDRVELIQAALSGVSGTMRFGGSETGARFDDQGDFEVRVLTMPQALDAISAASVDILKLDVEGAERDIFSTLPQNWMARVRMIVVEPHGDDIKNLIESVMAENNWRTESYRNLIYCQPAHVAL